MSATSATSAPGELAGQLAAIVGEKYVTRSARALARIGIQVAGDEGQSWLLQPGSSAEIAELIRLAGRHGVAVIPVGSATRNPDQEAVRQRPRFFVDTRRMDHVLHLDETSLVVHVQAGLTAAGLERILAPRGLSLGDYPPAALGSTIGGLLAVRTPGKASPRHGFLEDAVLGLSAVLADGRSVHTRVAPRRATGPDLARALCGSEGTLGFITAAVLRIHRRPEARLLAAHALPSFEAGVAAVHLALREEAQPAAIRVYDPDEAAAHLGPGVVGPGEALLVAATAGPVDLAACDRDLVASAAAALGGRPLGPAPAEVWWRARTGRAGAPLPAPVFQVAATPSKQVAVYQAVRAAIAATGLLARAHASRFDADGAVLFFTFLPAAGEAPLAGEPLAAARATAEAAARTAGGYLLGRGNPALASYFVELRRALDPLGIMNPGALTG